MAAAQDVDDFDGQCAPTPALIGLATSINQEAVG